MQLKDIGTFNQSGVYALINHQEKRLYLGCSKDMLKALIRILDDLKTNKQYSELLKDYDKLEFCTIETSPSTSSMAYLRLRLGYFRILWENNGYSFYNSDKGLRLRVNSYLGSDSKVYVEVVSQSNKRIIVGVFNRVRDADSFIKRHYGSPISEIVYADNRNTERFLKGLKP